jgi:hypothetical protein
MLINIARQCNEGQGWLTKPLITRAFYISRVAFFKVVFFTSIAFILLYNVKAIDILGFVYILLRNMTTFTGLFFCKREDVMEGPPHHQYN